MPPDKSSKFRNFTCIQLTTRLVRTHYVLLFFTSFHFNLLDLLQFLLRQPITNSRQISVKYSTSANFPDLNRHSSKVNSKIAYMVFLALFVEEVSYLICRAGFTTRTMQHRNNCMYFIVRFRVLDAYSRMGNPRAIDIIAARYKL